MFTLAIADADTTTVSTHPGRDVAYAELVTFLEATGRRLRVVAAAWTHADYEILGHDDRLIGHAAIDEICACTHAERDHEETGCTAISFDAGPFAECRCAGHWPTCTEADLFAPDVPT
jgi:hypothetical protein